MFYYFVAKDIFGNNLTHDILGNPLKKENKRQPVSSSQKKAIMIRQNGRCAECKIVLTGSVQYDHIKEVHKGGKSITDNLRAFCGSCHDKRHILDKAKEMDKKKKSKIISKIKNSFVNPLTGKKEKFPNWNI